MFTVQCSVLLTSTMTSGDYHQVNSVGTQNLAVSILFGRFDGRESLDFSDCSEKTGQIKHLLINSPSIGI